MKPDATIQWDDLLDRELKRLPEHPAPATLLPKIMAAIQAQAVLPWYRRNWWTWPAAAQAAFILAALIFIGVIVYWMPTELIQDLRSLAAEKISRLAATLTTCWNTLNALAGALSLALGKTGGWPLAAFIGGSLAAYATLMAVGTVAYRVLVAVTPNSTKSNYETIAC
jgi:hypothetical protein